MTSSLFAFQIKYFHSPRLVHTALSNSKARQVRSVSGFHRRLSVILSTMGVVGLGGYPKSRVRGGGGCSIKIELFKVGTQLLQNLDLTMIRDSVKVVPEARVAIPFMAHLLPKKDSVADTDSDSCPVQE